jgi:uncharacterized protein
MRQRAAFLHASMISHRRLSPSSLNQFLGCEHRTFLDLRKANGQLQAEPLPPDVTLLLERGERHERAIVDELQQAGRDVISLPTKGPVADREQATLAAITAGREVVHQACLSDHDWVGYADFLIRVPEHSDLGAWSYEVHDAKLGSHAQPRHLFQLLFYNDQLARIQGRRPSRIHLMLGDGERPSYSPEEFEAYAERVRARFIERRDQLAEDEVDVAYPYPVADCDFCPWWLHCSKRRRVDDHLSLVANLQRTQGLKLEQEGVHTVVDLAGLPTPTKVPRLASSTLDTLRAQAELQIQSRGLRAPRHELLKPEHDRGLARLPEPSPGDVFFDFEGDPYWGEDGLEYLFGTVAREGTDWAYEARWAEGRADEKATFEAWMDWITGRLAAYPDLHVFHYNHYEPTAIKKLMARHATRVEQVDALLSRKVFVDLFTVVRQAMRIGTESYGLKHIEPAFGYMRMADLKGAPGSLRRWQAFQQDQDRSVLGEIAAYNEDDCRSILTLRDWLWERRPEAESEFGVTLGTLQPKAGHPPGARQLEYRERVEAARAKLMPGLPDDESEDDDEQRARRIAFDLVAYHEREDKPEFWEFFARRDASAEDLLEDSAGVSGLTVLTGTAREDAGASWRWQLVFPPQDYKLREGRAHDPDAGDPDGLGYGVAIEALDPATRTVTIKRSKLGGDEPPTRLIPGMPIATDAQRDALFRFADRIEAHGLEPCGTFDAATDILLRRPPRFTPGTPPLAATPLVPETLREQVARLDRSVLVIQGPPGTGKTFTGARLAVELMQHHGLRVGVMATAHKAIVNFLKDVDFHAGVAEFPFRGWKKKGEDPEGNYSSDTFTSSTKPPSGVTPDLVAATSWWWARENEFEAIDVLFVDEAGQVSLADAIAVSQGAKSTVLLGDPQQLAHVGHGTHLHGSGVSVLQHLFAGEQTIPRDRGVFLDKTWRMHPDICRFVSDTMYDHDLSPIDGCARQAIASPGLTGTGLRLLPVEHHENRSSSPEEAQVVAAELKRLLDGGRYTDRNGEPRDLTLDDVLIVAPYNAQVRTLKSVLPPGARVGTVDKFQGQQAPVVFFSMTSSSGEDVPRGMDFLFSRNRLNVAVSRAQALAVVVCSPTLMSTRCSTVEQMKLVNMLCQFAEAAT